MILAAAYLVWTTLTPPGGSPPRRFEFRYAQADVTPRGAAPRLWQALDTADLTNCTQRATRSGGTLTACWRLNPNTQHHYDVRAGNDYAPQPWSPRVEIANVACIFTSTPGNGCRCDLTPAAAGCL